MRIVWLLLGAVSLGLAGAGAVLPLLPATPFVLASAFCFSRSSPELYAWLVQNRMFGTAVRDWRARRAISLKGKVAAGAAIVLSLGLSLLAGVGAAVIAVQTFVLSAVLAFILTRTTT